MAPRVHITQPIGDDAVAWLRARAEVTCGYEAGAPDLVDVIEDLDGLLVRTRPIDAALIDRADRLRVISRFGVGYDNIDVSAATKKRIPVLITAAANSRAIAEHVFGALVNLYRSLARWDRDVRAGEFSTRDSRLGHEISGRRLGILGLGRIGTEVARIGRVAFDMPAYAYHPRLSPAEVAERGAEPVETVQQLAEVADVITVHVPRSAETTGLVGAGFINAMRRDAVLINVSRGGVVDEQALTEALRRGTIAGAAVDVYEQEPPPPDHPFFELDNVLLTAHTAGHNHETFQRMAMDAATGLMDVLDGRRPPHVVNPEVLA